MSPAVITLTRPVEITYAARSYKIYVNGVKVAGIRTGKTVDIPLPPGEHRIKVKIDWCSSPELIVNIGPGQRAFLDVRRGGATAAAAWNQLFQPHRFLALTAAQS
ncbi:hypothetical protein ODJ79_24780 [Actinoplanes sp. KI2]|uniref:hypothetical protein n=1 Tax=Actinoplanes sp. KI2 TaxID=2983315 RepID=UPI0021D5E639|nr:hypothetical protein [Actinoplanes sp. KI2]MCU7726955.1 hypothetical protein [Actinoplanes sp. KI2]